MFGGHGPTVQVTAGPLNCAHCKLAAAAIFTAKEKNKKKEAQVWRMRRAACAYEHEGRNSRRLVNISSSFLLLRCLFIPNRALAGSFFDKYVKRKKLDPLEVYLPAIILTQLQIKDLKKNLEDVQPQYGACRSLLRYGPAASLRVNIRAVAQYAMEGGNGDAASTSVDKCLRALEELDSSLLQASRNARNASIESMKTNIGIVIDALDSLLHTVPPDVLHTGQAMADSYRTPSENMGPEALDSDLKQLESIL